MNDQAKSAKAKYETDAKIFISHGAAAIAVIILGIPGVLIHFEVIDAVSVYAISGALKACIYTMFFVFLAAFALTFDHLTAKLGAMLYRRSKEYAG